MMRTHTYTLGCCHCDHGRSDEREIEIPAGVDADDFDALCELEADDPDYAAFSCDDCAAASAKAEAWDSATAVIEQAASAAGWESDWRDAQTGTRYFTLTRDDDTLKVRLADHGTCYATEDVSVNLPGATGDGIELDQFAGWLANRG